MPPAELDPFQAFLKGSEQFFKQSGDEIGKAFDSVAQALSLPLPKKAEEQPTEARPESLASAPAAVPAAESPVLAPAPAVAVKAEPSTGAAPNPAAGVISEDAAVPEEQSTAAPETPVVAEVERSSSAVETATTATVEEPMVDFSKKKKKKKKKQQSVARNRAAARVLRGFRIRTVCLRRWPSHQTVSRTITLATARSEPRSLPRAAR